jgi:hypothetical protein
MNKLDRRSVRTTAVRNCAVVLSARSVPASGHAPAGSSNSETSRRRAWSAASSSASPSALPSATCCSCTRPNALLPRRRSGRVLAELHQRSQAAVPPSAACSPSRARRALLAQPAGGAEALVDRVSTHVQRRVRGLPVLVFPGIVAEQVTLDGGGDLATLESDGRCSGASGPKNSSYSGGERGIRTPEARFRRLHTFQACSFNRSDTSPLEPAMPRRGDIPGRAV